MLETSLEKVCFIIVKAREFDVPEGVVENDPASNATDDAEHGVLAAYADDPAYDELRELLDDLNEDEASELVALTWVGRGEYDASEWDSAVAEARGRKTVPTTDYLLGTPLLPDLLEEGLDAFGYSCVDFEMGRL